MNKLEAKNLSKKFSKRMVVNDVSLSIGQGQIVGLLGPNGAGKTTCFYLLVGLLRCDKGQVLLGERDITHLAMHQRARCGMGYLPQEASVFRKLTSEENIMAILQLRKDLNKKQRRERCEALLNEFHITGIRHNLGLILSGGERRRVEIARSLATEPNFILLDEPFAGIDPLAVIDIKRLIVHLSERGIGVLITDHNVRETLDICHHAYIVNEGKILASGTPQHLLSIPKVREVYLGEDFML